MSYAKLRPPPDPPGGTSLSFSSSHCSDEDSLYDVLTEVTTVTRWFNLGLALGLVSSTLEKIRVANRGGKEQVDDCKKDVLLGWLRMVDRVPERGVPSWRSLAIALNSPIVHYPHIASKIARKYKVLRP